MLKKLILFTGLTIPLVYSTSILLLSFLSGVSFNEVILYQYVAGSYLFPSLVAYFIKPLAMVSGILLIMCCPGILYVALFMRNSLKLDPVKFFSLAFILNIFLLFFGTSLIKLFGITIERFHFIAIIFTESIIGFFITLRINTPFMKLNFSMKKSSIFCFILFIVIFICFVSFFPHAVFKTLPVNFDYSEEAILSEDFSTVGDLQEEFGIARHLKERLLPYWLINSLAKFGTYLYRPHLSFLLNFFSMVVFGESYFSLNILSLIFTFGIFLFAYKMICLDKGI